MAPYWDFLWSISSFSSLLGANSPEKHPTLHWSWRLNDNLLKHSVCASKTHQAISDFRVTHTADTTPLPLQWEALKCVLYRLFIKHGARLKADMSSIIFYLLS